MCGLKANRRSFETAEEVVREWRKKSDWSESIPKNLAELIFSVTELEMLTWCI